MRIGRGLSKTTHRSSMTGMPNSVEDLLMVGDYLNLTVAEATMTIFPSMKRRKDPPLGGIVPGEATIVAITRTIFRKD